MSDALNILNDFPPTPHDEWLAAVDKQLKGKPFEKALVKKSYEGIGIEPMYFKKDLEVFRRLMPCPVLPPMFGETESPEIGIPAGVLPKR